MTIPGRMRPALLLVILASLASGTSDASVLVAERITRDRFEAFAVQTFFVTFALTGSLARTTPVPLSIASGTFFTLLGTGVAQGTWAGIGRLSGAALSGPRSLYIYGGPFVGSSGTGSVFGTVTATGGPGDWFPGHGNKIQFSGAEVATTFVPEPSTTPLLALGLLGLGIAAVRSRRRSPA
ncbi:MAG: PEP-CTERM sorting domain-containing protein [Deltaproteobacteria bacterium]|nr:PEP-CTERM sorting domain-containing protein [Deltaproteobacteria bacterium]MBW2395502.1 PEP-CTERM sorting domain-containing protein [Deltaproteobacteria bacterium]